LFFVFPSFFTFDRINGFLNFLLDFIGFFKIACFIYLIKKTLNPKASRILKCSSKIQFNYIRGDEKRKNNKSRRKQSSQRKHKSFNDLELKQTLISYDIIY